MTAFSTNAADRTDSPLTLSERTVSQKSQQYQGFHDAADRTDSSINFLAGFRKVRWEIEHGTKMYRA